MNYSKLWLIMRLTTVILLITLMQVSAAGYAQKMTFVRKGATLEQIFNEIRKQTGYFVVYSDRKVNDDTRMDADFKNTELREVLDAIGNSQNLTYSFVEKNISFKPKEPSFLDRMVDQVNAYLNNIDARGRIVDESGKALEGATVVLKGTNRTAKTDAKGEFVIPNAPDDGILVIRYVGYKQLEIALKDAVVPLEIKLNVATGELEEVKIVYDDGYQKLNKERSTGSFVHIDNELFNRAVGTNVLDRIYNVTPGLINNPTAGNGQKDEIRIRGESSLIANKQPLVVVDNFPYEGDLNTLNPNDVESITVLKDAAASSIWGARAGNGVIVITTKKGSFNQANNISFKSDLNIGLKPDLFYIPYLSSKEIIELEKQQFSTGVYNIYDDQYPSVGFFPVLPQSIEMLLAARKKNKDIAGYSALNDPIVNAQLDELGNSDVRNDINKYIFKNSLDQQYSLSLSGGASTFNYRASLGYDNNEGQNLREESNRLSLNFNNTWKPLKNLEFSSSIVHTRSRRNPGGVSYASLLPGPGISVYTHLADDQGNPLAVSRDFRSAYVDTASYPGLLDWHYKPLDDYHYIDNTNKSIDTRISAMLKYAIQPWISAEFQFQNQVSFSSFKTQYGQESFRVRDGINKFMTLDATGKKVYPWPLGDFVELRNAEFKAWNVRGNLRFDKQFGNHNVSAFGGIELRENTNETRSNTLYGFNPETYLSVLVNPLQSFPIRPRGTSVLAMNNTVTGLLNRYGSYFANAAYNYKGRYLATVSGRMDQSNFFGVKANLRRVPLWSTGVAWNIHQETFYKLEWMPLLKLRASYGYTGNANPGASSYATVRYQTGSEQVPPRNITYGRLLTPNNPELRWERVKVINLGIDFGLRNERLSGSIELYSKVGMDLLSDLTLDPTTGFALFTGNQSSTRGKGFDLSLHSRNIVNSAFEWFSTLNLGFNKDKLTHYTGTSIPTSSKPSTSSAFVIGGPLTTLYSYRWAGLDPTNGDPRLYLGDTISAFTNLTKAKDEDLVFHGQLNPKLFGSLINTFRWKQLSLSANVIYGFGHYFRRSSVNTTFLTTPSWSIHADYALRWKKPGDELITNVPSIPTSANTNRDQVYRYSDILVEKGDHIRLQDIRLSYALNRTIWKKFPLKQVSFYAYAANLGIIWMANKLKEDPDAYLFGNMPSPKTIAIGLNANF